jgi:NAD(P)-dependent dehydrogenase (short-subunit alcohol dehydrogenase family)
MTSVVFQQELSMSLAHAVVLITGANRGIGHALDALEAGAEEILADELTRQVKKSLSLRDAAYLEPVQ